MYVTCKYEDSNFYKFTSYHRLNRTKTSGLCKYCINVKTKKGLEFQIVIFIYCVITSFEQRFFLHVDNSFLKYYFRSNGFCSPFNEKLIERPLCGALPVPYVLVRVTRGALIAHRYTLAHPRCRTSQYRMTFIPLSVSLWNDLVDPVFDGIGLAGFKSRSNAFMLA